MSRTTGFVLALALCIALLPAAAVAQEPAPGQDAQAQPGDPATPAPETAQDEVPDIEELPEAEGERAQGREPRDESEPEPEPEREGAPAQVDRLNCDDFDTQEEAQDYFTDEGGNDRNNVDGLDDDGDGVACEALSAPAGGVDAGGGGTAPRPEATRAGPLPYLLGGAVLGLAFGVLSLTGRRRRARG